MKAIYGFPPESKYTVAIKCSLPSEFISGQGLATREMRKLRDDVDRWVDENIHHPCGFHYLPPYFRNGSDLPYVIWFTDDVEGVMFRMTWL